MKRQCGRCVNSEQSDDARKAFDLDHTHDELKVSEMRRDGKDGGANENVEGNGSVARAGLCV